MDDAIVSAFRTLANEPRFADRYMELRRDPGESSGGFDQQIRVATGTASSGSDRDLVKALEQFAAEHGLTSSTIEVGMMKRSSPGMPMVMLYRTSSPDAGTA